MKDEERLDEIYTLTKGLLVQKQQQVEKVMEFIEGERQI